MTADAQLRFIFMFHGRHGYNLGLAVRSQEDVARELKTTQATVARLERSAMRKLRQMPEVKDLLRYFSQLSTSRNCFVEPHIMRSLGPESTDSSYLTL